MRSSVFVGNLNTTAQGWLMAPLLQLKNAPRWHQDYAISIYSRSGELSWQILVWQVLSVFWCLDFVRSAFPVPFWPKKNVRQRSCLCPHMLRRVKANSSSTEILVLL